jgi:hypothetical protein
MNDRKGNSGSKPPPPQIGPCATLHLKGKKDADLFCTASARILRANGQAVLANKKPMKVEESLMDPLGVHHYLSVKFPLFDQTGEA